MAIIRNYKYETAISTTLHCKGNTFFQQTSKMKRFFKKIKAFLLESDHYKHLIGGFAAGMFGASHS